MTARSLSSGMAAEIVKPVVEMILLLEAQLADLSYVRYWTGIGSLSWDSKTWLGTGDLIGIGAVDESADLKGQSMAVQVNGIPPALVSLFLGSLAPGRPGTIWIGALNASGAVIADPYVLFRGRLDAAEINEQTVENPVATLTYQHELADLERPREWRWTDEHQKKLFSGDRGLEHIAGLQDAEIPFGNPDR